MSLADDIRTAQQRLNAHTTATIDTIRARLSSADRQALTAALDDPSVDDEAITAALLARGITAGPGDIARYRKRQA